MAIDALAVVTDGMAYAGGTLSIPYIISWGLLDILEGYSAISTGGSMTLYMTMVI